MRLTTQTDYALRLLMLLAVQPDRQTSIAEIAAHYDISKNHLMKVAHRLAHMSILATVRGRKGGVRLARPSAEITIGQIARALESQSSLVECFSPQSDRCRLTPACRLKGALADAVEAFFCVLDAYTLSDLVAHNGDLARRLTLEVA